MTITIYGELYSKKNSKRIVANKFTGKPFIISSSAFKKMEDGILAQLKANRHVWYNAIRYKEKPLEVHFKFIRGTARKFDYINIAQGLCDLMIKADWIEDDDAGNLIPVFDLYEIDKNNPRTEITIL
jgi:hypothetical protein